MKQIEGILLSKQKIISLSDGDVLHGMKRDEPGYNGFGEAYFSNINPGSVKAWKRHREMTLNFLVPYGKIKFVLFDHLENLDTENFQIIELSRDNYFRLTIPPMIWIGFQGLGSKPSLLLNIANIPHNPNEVDHLECDDINYSWS